MTNVNTATYIKKLVKMVYEKENQIEGLKKELRNANSSCCAGACRQEGKKPMEESIKHELFLASTQLKEVTLQMNTMENKMVELELGLEEEILKNNELEGEIAALKQENARMRQERFSFQQQIDLLAAENKGYVETIQKNRIEFKQISEQVHTLFESLQTLRNSQDVLRSEKYQLIMEINQIRQREEKGRVHRLEVEKQITFLKAELLQKQNQIELKEAELIQKSKEIEAKRECVESANHQIQQLNHQLNELTNINKSQAAALDNKQNELRLRLGENHHLGETLKDYEEFSFEISKYIESAYIKHCCQGHLRSSKKIIKETEKAHSMFESSFKKMTQIQNWMDETAEKLEGVIQQQEIPNQTLEDLSIIVRSFEEKLELCDLTERLAKENEDFIRNEEEVINNLQKDCQNSYERERSRIVQLGEMKEVLKMTKDVNRELLEQVNQRDCIISECKKIYEKCLPRNSQEFQLMKRVLDQV